MAGNHVNCETLSEPKVILTAPQLSTALTIEPSANKTVKIGDTFTIKATLSPDNVTNKKVNWTSSNPNLATVSTNETTSGTAITVTAKKTGTVTITATPADGQAQYAKSITVTINPLTIADISPQYYGDYMDYPVDNGVLSKVDVAEGKATEAEAAANALIDGTVPKTDWRVFYKDDTYVYLIASDYIPNSMFPNGIYTGKVGNYGGYWLFPPKGTTPTEKYKSRFLWNGLSSMLSEHENYRRVTYLLNTSLWKNFVDSNRFDIISNYAEACIGGPTLEMMCASWTSKTPNEPLYFGTNTIGYTIGKSSNGLTENYVSVNDYKGVKDTLYFPHLGSDLDSYCLASPAAANVRWIWDFNEGGRIGRTSGDLNDEERGLRPVVMLKSTLLAEKHDVDGIWEIKGNSLTLDVTEDQEKFICNTFEVTPTVHSSIENKNVNWYSSNTNVATVSTTTTESGTAVLVKCVGEGEATITAVLASDSKQSESFKVTVSDTYVNYPVDLGIANNTEHTLIDGTVPKTDWRIFYQDGTYTYLIAADYIPTSKFPAGVFTRNNGKYNGWWSSVPAGTALSWEYKDRFLFNGMNTVNSSNANYKATSYLLNTSLWTSMVDSTYADVAIGGPTLEMMCASWNKSTPNEPLFFGVNSTGYTVGKSINSLGSSDLHINANNTLYFPHNNQGNGNAWNNSYGYHLSSPTAYDTSRTCRINSYGAINWALYSNDDYSVRPVICLKLSTKLTKDTNGIWQLSN